MNPFGEARKLRDRLLALEPSVFATTDETEELKGKLPAVAIEVENSNGEMASTSHFKASSHNVTITCLVSAQNVSFDDACDASVALSVLVQKNMRGVKIRVKENGIDYGGFMIGSQKARGAVMECEAFE